MFNIYDETISIINKKELDRNKLGKIFKFKPKENDKVILVLGLNPGGEQEQEHNGILYFPEEYNKKLFEILKKEEKNEKGEVIKEAYIFPRYYKPLYDLIVSVDGDMSMFWKASKKETIRTIKDMLKVKCDDNKIIKDFEENAFKKEKNKYMIFGDLFYYHTVNHKELENVLTKNKETLNKYIENIMDYFIKTYKPKLILINSTLASEKIQEALFKEKENNEIIDILLLKKEEEKNKYKLEKYNEKELKGNIPIVFTADMTQFLDRLSKKRLERQLKDIWREVTK